MGPLMIGVPKKNNNYLKDHVYFVVNFRHLVTKKKQLANPTKGFFIF
jgi:hypothetical protein